MLQWIGCFSHRTGKAVVKDDCSASSVRRYVVLSRHSMCLSAVTATLLVMAPVKHNSITAVVT